MSEVSQRGLGLRIAFAGLTLALTLAGAWWLLQPPASERAEDLGQQGEERYTRADYVTAEELAAAAHEFDPSRGDMLLLAAQAASAQQESDRAVQYLKSMPRGNDRWYGPAMHQLGVILHYELFQLGNAEEAYRAALAADPDNTEVIQELARLLSVCGRRDEAVTQVIELIRLGVESDLIILLARESGGLDDELLLQKARESDPGDAIPLLGLAWRAVSSGNSQQAIPLLNQATQKQNAPPTAWGLLLRELSRLGDWPRFHEAYGRAPESAAASPDYWMALAVAAEHQNDPQGAARAWWEALSRRPESKQAASQLARLLERLGYSDDAARCAAWSRKLHALGLAQHRALFSDDEHDYEDLKRLVRTCQETGRFWEAAAWGRVAQQLSPNDQELADTLRTVEQRLPSIERVITMPEHSPTSIISPDNLPVPSLMLADVDPQSNASDPVKNAAFKLRDCAAEVGLRFSYFNGVGEPSQHRMFEFTGGGIGVLDLDRDLLPDVFLTQGTRWPPDQPVTTGKVQHDAVFRNSPGGSFAECSETAGTLEHGFGQGVAVGDCNNDGFPDVYVANIGANTLWINQGDGTFLAHESSEFAAEPWWTTSCAMVDFNDDGALDLFDVNYVTSDDVFERTCSGADGTPVLCAPHDFEAAPDQVLLSRGDGAFRRGNQEVFSGPDRGNGLGIVAWREPGRRGLSVFVANDKTANALLRRNTDSGIFRLENDAFTAGVAFNGEGDAEACMGIAVDDVDNDAITDLFVTNFWHESNTLYVGSPSGYFIDRTRQWELADPSMNLLGFGAQFVDLDLDGRSELFVTNGHIEDVGLSGQPFRMPPLLLSQTDGQFRPTAGHPEDSYLGGRWTGRAVARCDWNADGADDLFVGHLHEPVALLTNETARRGNSLSLRLSGKLSRDAVGTTVRIRAGALSRSRQLTAGDGYQCSNARVLNIGCGPERQVDELEIQWPGGDSLRVTEIAVPGNYLADERKGRLFALPAAATP